MWCGCYISPHFDAAILRRVGAWDPYNVTEDADLGFRLARLGYGTAMISAPTLEEAPVGLDQWLPQRTRWVKGHIQTWLVLMRSPLRASGELGFGRFMAVQLAFGGALLAHFAHGPLILWTLLQCLSGAPAPTPPYLGMLAAGYASAALAAWTADHRRPSFLTMATMPLYWPLMSVAAARALWEMRSRPHIWAKTRHGASPAPDAHAETFRPA